MATRRYVAPARQQAAELTRRRLLDAARVLLGKPGVPKLTADSVSLAAGVSRQTLYNTFGSRGGLLEALCDDLATGAELDLRQAFAQPDLAGGLAVFVTTFCRLWSTDQLALRRLRGLSALEPELAAVLAARDGRRHSALRALLGRYGVPAAPDVLDPIWALTSFETFDLLAGQARDTEAAATAITNTICRLLAGRASQPTGT